ncbi:tyrosine-type recombinase/integrase [Planctomicrobium piriforme]|uniref:Phage integrase family protein n=1 Tax=Planctomicrobium piriforme TaxID=1576369 RepID=A0A1I3P3J3_9PLAN|nr:tyrosine-type recombinase/integrase [Planctomicrobium piriforme]SFJ16011.1 Phage integrase family protein [Planctomicrobium piriforme]
MLKSSVGTVRRYRSATQHLIDFAGEIPAHAISADGFALFLRQREVSPNGHQNTPKRRLRDKGVRNILEICRSLYAYANRARHLPPYTENPFAVLSIDRMRIEDAKSIFVFDQALELGFLQQADDWAFPINFVLAKTGLRVGELTHLLIEEVDLNAGWLQIRNKPDLGWQIKTRNERSVPVIAEVVAILKHVIGNRTSGPVFLRPSFRSGNRARLEGDRQQLAVELKSRTETLSPPPLRERLIQIARTVWRDAGAIKVERVRISFMRTAAMAGHPQATCPKSWRHSMATLLQDANVDPLIRQITLGHKPTGAAGELGMTAVYTHTRPKTQRTEIERALRLWPESLAFSQLWLERQGCRPC